MYLGRVSVVEAMKVPVEAVRVLIKGCESAHRGRREAVRVYNILTASTTLSQL